MDGKCVENHGKHLRCFMKGAQYWRVKSLPCCFNYRALNTSNRSGTFCERSPRTRNETRHVWGRGGEGGCTNP